MLFYLGLLCLLGGIYFLLVNLNIIKKSVDTSDKPIEAKKIDNLLIRFAAIALLVLGVYMMWPTDESKPNVSKEMNSEFENTKTGDIRVWSNELKDILTKQCLENGKRTAINYPELVNDYCKCATEKISQSMNPDEYTQWMEKPTEEQAKYIRPIVQSCIDIMTKLIQLSQEVKPEKEDLK